MLQLQLVNCLRGCRSERIVVPTQLILLGRVQYGPVHTEYFYGNKSGYATSNLQSYLRWHVLREISVSNPMGLC